LIGLDTNVVVRHLAGVGEGNEVERARSLLRSLTSANPGYISLITLIESWWVLGSVYDADVFDRLDALENLLRVNSLTVERRHAVQSAIAATRHGADFADALIFATCADEHCESVMTFDKRAAKRAGMTIVPPAAESAGHGGEPPVAG
jgi:predicted nucleic-acid-binding protein